ncbi:diaminopimelate epimerase [Maribacter algarum]|uniref:Diaminopimelate epimerase n=1 Tax=Maribacter algarum (ex Zhang et al. 2020) TaxID=2578118 RepID=A0A5S3PHB5_9FLAO|nr:diaminopimelate epimerase [Maribacter algarum]TMM53629.1 diaminopimelate epimerase [Maribacter algarum]
MRITFFKYQGTGNDFVIIDNRNLYFPKENSELVATLCDRKFGVGADGLILLENDPDLDFNMVYYNSDGNTSTMCGNGGRCLVAFAQFLGVIDKECVFNAIDGKHTATIDNGIVSLQMKDVSEVTTKPNSFYLDTGSPHHVQLVENLKDFNVPIEGAKLRYGIYGESGSNINFVEQKADDSFAVRTYERGVENETLSCGTGVTAVAIAMYEAGKTNHTKIDIETEGGYLAVHFESVNGYKNVFLVGPARQVFKGELEC